jgi:oxygen-dependent protoporphyrinogen oxidase
MTHRVVIVGAGISGLAAAHRLTELSEQLRVPIDLTVLEAEARPGGAIQTTRHDGFLMEHGPDAFITDKPWAVDLCRRVGLASAIVPTSSAARRSFIVRRGRPVPVPEGLYLMAPVRLGAFCASPIVSWRAKLRMACEPWVPARRGSEDESVASFVRRRFGREALARVGQPMIGGIYAGDVDRLSLEATLPRFRQLERRHGSVIRGLQRAGRPGGAAHASGPRYGLFVSLRHGLKTLVEALRGRLPDGALHTGARVAAIERAPTRVRLHDGRALEADSLCLAMSAPQAAALLQTAAPALARQLAGIRYETVATVNLGVLEQDLPAGLHGAGVVVPAVERRAMIGCSFSSLKFPERAPAGGWLVRAFVGGALHPDVLARDDTALVRLVQEELRALLGVSAAPRCALVSRHPEAMPQYDLGHLGRVAAIEEEARAWPGLQLLGNGFRGLGLPDCIWRAERAAERIIAPLVGLDGTAAP